MLTPMARKSGNNEVARERSKAALLQAGADLMLEDASRQPFAALRLRRLCEKAALSTGAFYVHWASLEEYYRDLAKQLTEENELAFDPDFQSLDETAEAHQAEGAFQAITRVADQDLHLLVRNPHWDAME